jgi:PAS domain S-box-containing protein
MAETPQAKELLAAIVESSDDAIVSKNLNGIVLSWNAAAERMFGWTAAEMLGQSIRRIIPADRQSEEDGILAKVRAGQRLDHVETVRQRKDGTLVEVSLTVSPVRNAHGEIVGASKIARDIGERKAMEREQKQREIGLHKAIAEAESANRAKDRFLAMLSHELRTPLTPVLAATSLIESGQISENVRQDMQIIRRNVELEARLIDDLLDLTRVAKGKLQLNLSTVELHEALRQTFEICAAEIKGKKHKVAWELNATETVARADRARVQQMIWNLLRNAAKFTPEGGKITIRTSDAGGWIRISVIDSGIGIAHERQGSLFEAFEQGDYTITRQYGGLGLGLAITRALADLHGGRVEVFSDGEGKGSTFSIVLPVSDREAFEPEDEKDGWPVRPLRILLVEDHADTARVMTRLLNGLNHTVKTVGTVHEAEEAAIGGSWELMISDLGLPDGTGIELVQRLKGRVDMPAIALSGFGMEEDVRRCLEAGFAAHLTKPVNLELLGRVIAEVDGGR